ncbi:MAG: S8 family serine peptidase [bacterium]|nr:S8 family serine peptidase [bacterium]
MHVRHLSRVIAVALVWMICTQSAFASGENTIRLRSREFTPEKDYAALATISINANRTNPVHCIVQLDTDAANISSRSLESTGVKLLEPLGGNAWLASLAAPVSAADAEALGLRWAGELTVEDKLHSRAANREFESWMHYENGLELVFVRLHADVPAEAGRELAERYNAELGDYIEGLNTWVFAIDPNSLEQMAAEDKVEFVDLMSPPMTEVNDVARGVVGANALQAAPYNLDGSGISVLVYDGGLISAHTDFTGRLTLGEVGTTADHPTHVAGSVGGSGALSAGVYRGMAPACNIISMAYESCSPYCLYNSPQDIVANYTTARNTHSADLATNSIGANIAWNGYSCTWEGDYESVSQLLDNIVRGSLGSPFIVLFAAGNERGGACGSSYGTMGVPANAKNIISVGASTDADAMTTFSSWGPTDDGRIKPDVCAPGLNIHSTLPGNTYGDMSGTSMATPITSGCVALMLEQVNASYPGLVPLPSTVKALLINTAVDLGNAGPDYVYGFGRINAQAAVDAIIEGGFLEASVSSGQTNTHTFTVLAGTTTLRTSLSWMDPAANPLANPTLVNDLNITLTSPSATVYYPFTLTPASPATPAGTGIDHINNSEQIVVASPEAGTWTITINSTTLPSGPQSYSLACSETILAGYGHVSGVVTDANTLLPLAGTVVQNVSGVQSDTTDANGLYDLSLPAGNVTLEFSKFGYTTANEAATVADGGTVIVNKALSPVPSATLTGIVYNPSSIPVPGAQVSVVGFPVTPATTNGSGAYSLSLPVGATYTVRADATGYGGTQHTMVFNGPTSQDFTLSVLSNEDWETGNFTRFPWTQTGNAPWTITSTGQHAGLYCARSGVISNDQQSTLSVTETVVVGGPITFFYKVSSEASYDFLHFLIDGVEQGSWSGEVAWTQASYNVTAGTHTFTWNYTKDVSLTGGSDASWVDDIVFPTLQPPPEFTLSNAAVTPASGLVATPFTYSVLYTSATNTPPVTATIVIDGAAETMTTFDFNYSNGSQFLFSTTHSTGTHDYYVEFTGPTLSARLPETGVVSQPTVWDYQQCYDFESGTQGWALTYTGDNATSGLWGQYDPTTTVNGSGIQVQPGDDHTPATGLYCLCTDGRAGTSHNTYDVDGGRTTIVSPTWDLSGFESAALDVWSWYSNDLGNSPGTDSIHIWASADNGATWTTLLYTNDDWEYWKEDLIQLESFIPLTSQVKVRISVADLGSGSTIEAAVDDICLYALSPQTVGPVDSLVVLTEDMNIHLFWTAAENAATYRIEKAAAVDSIFTTLATVPATTLDYIDVNAAATADMSVYHVIAER